MKKPRISMRFCIVLLILLIGILPMVAGMSVIRILSLNYAYQTRTETMTEQAETLAKRITENRYLEQQSQPDLTAELHALSDLYDGRIVLVNASLVVVYDTADREQGKTFISKEPIKALRGEESLFYRKQEAVAELTIPIGLHVTEKGQKQAIGALIFTASLSDIEETRLLFRENGIVLTVGCGALLLLIALILAHKLTNPLRRLSNRIKRVTESYDGSMEHNQEERTTFSEVAQISDDFTEMMVRVTAMEKSRQEFVSNVSHELKTPLTAIKVLSDALVLEPDAPIEMYREFNQDINAEIEREAKIVNDLLTLVRLDKTSGEMHIAEVNINELLEITMRRLKPLALKRGIEMTIDSYRTVLAEVDEVKMSIIITNLIENAIKYNRDGGKIMVSLNSDHRYFYLKVEDTGVGIPEEEQGLIFDRFYRVDKARSRETGGTGLGLSITKSAIQMHKGSVKVQSVLGVGTIFTVRIPLSFVVKP